MLAYKALRTLLNTIYLFRRLWPEGRRNYTVAVRMFVPDAVATSNGFDVASYVKAFRGVLDIAEDEAPNGQTVLTLLFQVPWRATVVWSLAVAVETLNTFGIRTDITVDTSLWPGIRAVQPLGDGECRVI